MALKCTHAIILLHTVILAASCIFPWDSAQCHKMLSYWKFVSVCLFVCVYVCACACASAYVCVCLLVHFLTDYKIIIQVELVKKTLCKLVI